MQKLIHSGGGRDPEWVRRYLGKTILYERKISNLNALMHPEAAEGADPTLPIKLCCEIKTYRLPGTKLI